MNEHKLPPIHPGEILLEEFLEPLGISQYRLAKDISVSRVASTRLYRANGPSLRILRCACPATLGCLSASGSTFRHATIWRLK